MTLNHIKIIMSCNVYLSSCAIGAYVRNWLSLLMTSVTRVNPLQIAIASGSGLEDWPCLSMSRRVTWAGDLGCSIGTRVTWVTRVAQSKSVWERPRLADILPVWSNMCRTCKEWRVGSRHHDKGLSLDHYYSMHTLQHWRHFYKTTTFTTTTYTQTTLNLTSLSRQPTAQNSSRIWKPAYKMRKHGSMITDLWWMITSRKPLSSVRQSCGSNCHANRAGRPAVRDDNTAAITLAACQNWFVGVKIKFYYYY